MSLKKTVVIWIACVLSGLLLTLTAIAYVQGPDCAPAESDEEFPIPDPCVSCLRVFPCWYCWAAFLGQCECDGEGGEGE